jgi:hypothetical protein
MFNSLYCTIKLVPRKTKNFAKTKISHKHLVRKKFSSALVTKIFCLASSFKNYQQKPKSAQTI